MTRAKQNAKYNASKIQGLSVHLSMLSTTVRFLAMTRMTPNQKIPDPNMLSTTVRSSAMTRVKQKLSDMQTHHTLDSLQTNLRWNTNHDNNVKNKLGWRLILLICMIMQTFTMPIKYS